MRTAVVTGGNRGIGRVVVESLLDKGCRVVTLVRDPTGVPAGAEVVTGDLSSTRTVAAAADAVRDTCPAVGVLVHNAGLWPTALAHNENGLELSFAVNHLAPFQLTRAGGPPHPGGSGECRPARQRPGRPRAHADRRGLPPHAHLLRHQAREPAGAAAVRANAGRMPG
ncbi:SDR family NAD(P)-dependent oxidoreductase [Actinophytocola sp.]|uniref:SDR family NAD(P)-dependent oxidoreductase n=1 Tax=Actinophytocola sp. TaxID=1872138 RepID=UPI0025C5D861|nr:SDR family NAD(P)-dependent oxidoreductase [Actinophytocola sp.]